MQIPRFETPRLTLRGFTPEDLEPMAAILAERDVVRYFPRSEPWPREIVQKWLGAQRDHWQRHGYGWWALERRDTAEVIGWCGIGFLEETNETEVLYLLGQAHWGLGLATEAAEFSIRYAFDNLPLRMIVGIVHPENYGSRHVLEKIGLMFSNPAPYFGLDMLRYTIDRRQFEARHAPTGAMAIGVEGAPA